MLSFNFLAIFTIKCNDYILLAFFLVSLFSVLFIKYQMASFQLKEIVVFLN